MLINNVGLPGEMCCRGDFSPPRSLLWISSPGWGSEGLQRDRLSQHPAPLRGSAEGGHPFLIHAFEGGKALRKPRTNTGVFPRLWPWLPSWVLLLSQILFLYFSFSSPPGLLLFPRSGVGAWRGVARRCGYIWLFIENLLGTHTSCFLHDAAWHLSGSHVVLTHT